VWALFGFAVIASLAIFGVLGIIYGLLFLFVLFV